MTTDKDLKAAARLEELLIIGKQMVDDIRTGEGPGNGDAYSLLYWLRKEISYVVATRGEGAGSALGAIKAHYERLV